MASEKSIARFAEALGPEPIDILYNDAGIDARWASTTAPATCCTRDHFLAVMRVDAVRPMLLVRALLDRLGGIREPPRREHVVAGGIDGGFAHTIGRDVSYTSSKAALNMISVRQSVHLRDTGIIVVAVHPGFLKTDMGGEARLLATNEGARGVIEPVDGLTQADSGTFRQWDGAVHPW